MTNIVTRGYVLVRSNDQVSAIVQRAQAERMQKRFGGKVIDVRGQKFRMSYGHRVLVEAVK